MTKKRGVALIMSFIVIIVLTIFSVAIVSSSISESRIAKRYAESTQGFWLAEAGVNRAQDALRNNYNTIGNSLLLTTLGPGQYSVDIAASGPGNQNRTVTAHGFIPTAASFRVERIIQAVMIKVPSSPVGFYNNVLYSAGGINVQGASNSLEGNVTYAGNLNGTLNIVPGTGTATNNPAIAPLAVLDYDLLRTISQNQGNYHDAQHLDGPFPSSFWFSSGVPNVVFLEGILDLTGKTIVHGFFVVGGDVAYNATISGNVAVDGCIYTRGNFRINGGGGTLNINGGVWVGGQTILNGGVDLHYNSTYMNAIPPLDINFDVQIVSWRDTQNPYNL